MSNKRICPICNKNEIWFSWENKCTDCQKKEYDNQIKENIVSGDEIRTYCESDIYCPWCGEKYEPDYCDDADVLYDEGEHELECPECEKRFRVITNISYSYDTDREVEEDA